MDKIGDVLRRFDPKSGKYISREFQAFGLYIAKRLDDEKHKTLYIRFAKTMPRFLLDEALAFTMDANAKNKGALFMWKLKEMGVWKSKAGKTSSKKAKPKL